jgi:hypothetical protein
MSSIGDARRVRYQAGPTPAYSEWQEAICSQLPIHVISHKERPLAWLCIGIGGIFLVALIGWLLEDLFLQESPDRMVGFKIFLQSIVVGVFALGFYLWKRSDELEFRHDRVRIQRHGLRGTETRKASISDYRCIRVKYAYGDATEPVGGVERWDVELEHKDPGLTITLFSRSRNIPTDPDGNPPDPATGWSSRMQNSAEYGGRHLGLSVWPEA